MKVEPYAIPTRYRTTTIPTRYRRLRSPNLYALGCDARNDLRPIDENPYDHGCEGSPGLGAGMGGCG